MDLKLQNKVALVTGGSRGIGRAIALQLAAEGCHVGICARSEPALKETIEKLTHIGVHSHGVVADVTQPLQLEGFISDCADKLGGIDILVCNAGGVVGKSLLESTASDWQQTFDLNFFHTVNAVRTCIPYMQQRNGGSILLISSISGSKPAPKSQYGAAKAAMIYLASSLARELSAYQIRINALSPGSTIFPEGGWEKFRQNNPEHFAKFEQEDFPAERLATPEEIADVATFLVSDRAMWINGTNIAVDGAQGKPSALGY